VPTALKKWKLQPSTSKAFKSSRTSKLVEMATSREVREPRAANTKAADFLKEFKNSGNYEEPLFSDDSNDSDKYRPPFGGKQLARLIVEALDGLGALTAAAKKVEIAPDSCTAVPPPMAPLPPSLLPPPPPSLPPPPPPPSLPAPPTTVTVTANRLSTADSRAPDADYISRSSIKTRHIT
ncbi:WASH complex subunit 3-like, partial [Homalodisca vitripennis]|uniref:WASH complex subunit 3-like n=1 Tax=Homalodisca vitripennis TaxID=197043 RepID=UPI001EEC388E